MSRIRRKGGQCSVGEGSDAADVNLLKGWNAVSCGLR